MVPLLTQTVASFIIYSRRRDMRISENNVANNSYGLGGLSYQYRKSNVLKHFLRELKFTPHLDFLFGEEFFIYFFTEPYKS